MNQRKSLIKKLDSAASKKLENKALANSYNKIKNSFIINRDDLEKFVVELNSILVEDIIQQLLESSEELVSGVFDDTSESE